VNTLKSVFWEYPDLANDQNLRRVLQQCRSGSDMGLYLWIMRRFLEHGRAVDTLKFFSIEEIGEHIARLRLSDYSSRKWRRLTEVYRAA
jgi:hypothetical protein